MDKASYTRLNAVLTKNVLIMRANWLSTILEIVLPILFMALLTYLKSMTYILESPAIAYYCGNTWPWFHSNSLTESASSYIPFKCSVKPATCQTENYYMIPQEFSYQSIDMIGYLQYGKNCLHICMYTGIQLTY